MQHSPVFHLLPTLIVNCALELPDTNIWRPFRSCSTKQ